MNSAKRSQAWLRKRKAMMVLPLLIIPFLTMAFWAMGGGKASKDEPLRTGLNLQLPIANLKEEKVANKLSFYDQATKDSLKLAELKRNDPYFQLQFKDKQDYELETIAEQSANKFSQSLNPPNEGLKITPYDKPGTPAEENVMRKLAELNEVINQHEPSRSKFDEAPKINSNFSDDVSRLENLMKVMSDRNKNDPEIKLLENTLDKILDIQHPERVKLRTKESVPEFTLRVSSVPDNEVSLLDTAAEEKFQPGFWGLADLLTGATGSNLFEAVVHENQVLVNGAVIKLRLVSDLYIDGNLISKGNFVYGTVSLNGERLEIQINSIRCGQSLYPINLEVYDTDGIPGIYIPGAITRDVAKHSADNSLQTIGLSTADPSLKAQATLAGISAAKSLLSKKVKQVRVMVKAGYKVLLKDKNVQQ